MTELRVAVIGGGPGGYVAAIRAAQLGADVTIIEKNKLGGTCLNIGCIPTKVLLHAAEFMVVDKEAAGYGITLENAGFDWSKVVDKKNRISSQLVRGINTLMKANGINVINGEAEFIAPEKIRVKMEDGKESVVAPDKIIIATGSVASIPPIPGLDTSNNWIDSTKALSLEKFPKSIIIVGGGVIGIEMAAVFYQFGSEVTILEGADKLMPLMDEELSAMLGKRLSRKKVKIKTNAMVSRVEDTDDGVKVYASVNGEEVEFEAETTLIAVGRRSYTDTLNLNSAGVETDRFSIKVNSKMETNVPGIYAIGDCAGGTMLAHVASQQGEIAAENAMGMSKDYDEKTCPSCVYADVEFAGVGITEQEAKAKGINYRVGKFPLKANGKALIINNGDGCVKYIVDAETEEILGVHILGARATDLITEAAVALGMNAKVDDIANIIHPHPTVSESLKEGALASVGRAIHIPNV